MFRVKICGITTVDDGLDAAVAGADALGLNFYSRSKRRVDLDAAERISLSAAGRVLRVGVFVNSSAEEIVAVLGKVELDAVQLHGDEPPELLAELPRDISIIRAQRCAPQGLELVASYLADCRARGRMPDAMLIDADATTEFGGTGRQADWRVVARDRDYLDGLPLILAGGLTPGNVAEAITAVRPAGVDVASGVERAPGKKDATLTRQFIAAARKAFENP